MRYDPEAASLKEPAPNQKKLFSRQILKRIDLKLLHAKRYCKVVRPGRDMTFHYPTRLHNVVGNAQFRPITGVAN